MLNFNVGLRPESFFPSHAQNPNFDRAADTDSVPTRNENPSR